MELNHSPNPNRRGCASSGSFVTSDLSSTSYFETKETELDKDPVFFHTKMKVSDKVMKSSTESNLVILHTSESQCRFSLRPVDSPIHSPTLLSKLPVSKSLPVPLLEMSTEPTVSTLSFIEHSSFEEENESQNVRQKKAAAVKSYKPSPDQLFKPHRTNGLLKNQKELHKTGKGKKSKSKQAEDVSDCLD